jgi:hypothetical protein
VIDVETAPEIAVVLALHVMERVQIHVAGEVSSYSLSCMARAWGPYQEGRACSAY